ncbi:hypothetical protein D0812_17005 [Vibrio owensii]|uniref:Uncharacterized protein n=2 Tax=Vibrio owensii TaxID=696485 RepID=A0AAP9GEE6_9VIBR|nr:MULTISPECIES: hypothetical protein [Vibrio harveyi group]ELA6921268.1 hypothetical protein [Vibrio parahaemolyticus]ARR42933.1 hypothetical protein CAY59_00030 [Vibrio campbellii]ARR47751.1 hypothetical protein CAY59_26670 [Vibrio campbellii]AYO16011.1 hypothetical protein D0812_17005 [Vibrio owensii]QGH48648.1 hypothetical protein APZ19_16750 [Vibrio owensii]
MKYHVQNGKPGFNYTCDRGIDRFIELSTYHLQLKDRDVLSELMILYCQGKRSASYVSWIKRINSTLYATFEYICIDCLPTNATEWRELVKQAYGKTLVSPNNKALSTRVDEWNKNLKPFLVFLQDRDVIPPHVIIPRMKKTGELTKKSNFKAVLIGEKKATEVKVDDTINNVLVPISLSRSDAEYLDEIHFDLKRSRNALHDCLLKYWQAIKLHYDFAQSLMEEFPKDHAQLLARYKNGELYDYFYDKNDLGKNGKPKPPRRRHIANPTSLLGSMLLMYVVGSECNGIFTRHELSKMKLPNKISDSGITSDDIVCLPELGFESTENIDLSHRFDWCFGYLRNADIGCLIALLMMLNPKFTYISLLQAKVKYTDNKPLLELDDLGMSFSITKARASDMKKENLDDVSLEIIEFLHEIREKHLHLIKNKKQENFLFLAYSRKSKGLVNPDSCKVDKIITGTELKRSIERGHKQIHLSSHFPSLLGIGLEPGAINHSKIRASEGVLEWFRTGSIASASRVLGNTQKVALKYYIPEPLIAQYNTRLVRRFQNLLIVTAAFKEDYCLEAVDFNSWQEIHHFLLTLLEDEGNKSPLIEHLRNLSSEGVSSEVKGKLDVPLSENVLTALYLYRLAALNSSVSSKDLSIVDDATQLSPLAFITLANHLINFLPTSKESRISQIHIRATEQATKLLNKTSWSDLFVSKGKEQ